jgi:hypothetical protein
MNYETVADIFRHVLKKISSVACSPKRWIDTALNEAVMDEFYLLEYKAV